jgi:hypothetical protein
MSKNILRALVIGLFIHVGTNAVYADTCASFNDDASKLSPELSAAMSFMNTYFNTWNRVQDLSKLPELVNLFSKDAIVTVHDTVDPTSKPREIPAADFVKRSLTNHPKSVHTGHDLCVSGNKAIVGFTYSVPAAAATPGNSGLSIDMVGTYVVENNLVTALSLEFDGSWLREQGKRH